MSLQYHQDKKTYVTYPTPVPDYLHSSVAAVELQTLGSELLITAI